MPTTAVALLAMQDRRSHPVVERSLELPQRDHATSERSGTSLALRLCSRSRCLRTRRRRGSGRVERAVANYAGAPKSCGDCVVSTRLSMNRPMAHSRSETYQSRPRAVAPTLPRVRCRSRFSPRAAAVLRTSRQFPGASRSSPVGLFPPRTTPSTSRTSSGAGSRELGVDVRGRRVFLKPNMVEYERGHGHQHPSARRRRRRDRVPARRRARGRRRRGAGPPPRHRISAHVDRALSISCAKSESASSISITTTSDRCRSESRFTGLRELALPVALLQADFVVSMPKLKTHHWAGMTCSMKNFFGVVPGAVYGWPKNMLHVRGIDNSIVDLDATIRPQLRHRRRGRRRWKATARSWGGPGRSGSSRWGRIWWPWMRPARGSSDRIPRRSGTLNRRRLSGQHRCLSNRTARRTACPIAT